MQYYFESNTVNVPVEPLRTIDAHSVPHWKASKAARACDGADILDGLARLQNLTFSLVAAAMRVSVTYLVAAHRLSPQQRGAVRRGERPLILPRTPVSPVLPKPVPVTPPVPPVVMDDAREQLLGIVAVHGLNCVLDWLSASEKVAA